MSFAFSLTSKSSGFLAPFVHRRINHISNKCSPKIYRSLHTPSSRFSRIRKENDHQLESKTSWIYPGSAEDWNLRLDWYKEKLSFKHLFKKKSKSSKESSAGTPNSSSSGNSGSNNETSPRKDQKNNDENGPYSFFSSNQWVLIVSAPTLLLSLIWFFTRERNTEIAYQQFLSDLLMNGLVEKLQVVNHEKVRIVLDPTKAPKGNAYYFTIGSIEQFEHRMAEAENELGLPIPTITYIKEHNYLATIIGFIPPLLFIALIYYSIGATGSIMSQGLLKGTKNTAKKWDKKRPDIRFADVAGCDEAKIEIMEFVSFLKSPEKYKELGAKIPKGALLSGPPGTGKTLLAKATAGEAGVPFFSVSGSGFEELYVGVGAARVRDLFKQARACAPSIIFIDEIDAVGRSRDRSSFRNDEREATLNQLLVEMDGFKTSDQPVIVMAGTNRADVLDSALTRPGRFDRNIVLELPDVKARGDIFRVHLPKLTLDFSTEWYAPKLAAMTPGFSGADIANLCNEAALIAARKGYSKVELIHFEMAIDRVIGGLERKSLVVSPQEKKTVAFHEAGHVVTSWFLEFGSPLLKVSIVPRGPGLGYAMYIPEERSSRTREQLLHMIIVSLGGRAAEELTFGEITTGATDDLEKVTKIAYSLIMNYGMSSSSGPASFGYIEDQGFSKGFSEATNELIDQEARALVSECYERAKSIITEHKEKFTKLAEFLLVREVMSMDDCREILGERPWAPSASALEYIRARESISKNNTEGEIKVDQPSSTPNPQL